MQTRSSSYVLSQLPCYSWWSFSCTVHSISFIKVSFLVQCSSCSRLRWSALLPIAISFQWIFGSSLSIRSPSRACSFHWELQPCLSKSGWCRIFLSSIARLVKPPTFIRQNWHFSRQFQIFFSFCKCKPSCWKLTL